MKNILSRVEFKASWDNSEICKDEELSEKSIWQSSILLRIDGKFDDAWEGLEELLVVGSLLESDANDCTSGAKSVLLNVGVEVGMDSSSIWKNVSWKILKI